MGRLSGSEQVFLVGTICVFPPAAWFIVTKLTTLVADRVESEARDQSPFMVEQLQRGLTHPKWSDLYITLAWALLISALREVSSRYFQMLGEKYVSHKKVGRSARVKRFGDCFFKLIYFVSITIFGWKVLLPQSFMPTVLGGTGHYREAWVDYPRINASWDLKIYYLFQLGYHVHELVYHCFLSARRNGNLLFFF